MLIDSTLGSAASAVDTLVARQQWQHLEAQLHRWPAQLAPVQVAPVAQPQLIVQLAGAMHLQLTSQSHHRRFAAVPGSVYLTPAQQPTYEMAWRSPDNTPVDTLHVHLETVLFEQAAAAAGYDPARLELRDDSCFEDPLLRQLGLTLAQVLTRPAAPDVTLYVEQLTHLLAGHLVYAHVSPGFAARPPRTGRLRPAQLRQVQEYVQAHLTGPLTVQALAGIACVSAYHFCRAFKATTGSSPTQYVMAQRVARARQLLRQGQLSVGQVARSVGYRSAEHFSAVFRRQTGQLPAAYGRFQPAAGLPVSS